VAVCARRHAGGNAPLTNLQAHSEFAAGPGRDTPPSRPRRAECRKAPMNEPARAGRSTCHRCDGCGGDFRLARAWSRFCSPACRLRAHHRLARNTRTLKSATIFESVSQLTAVPTHWAAFPRTACRLLRSGSRACACVCLGAAQSQSDLSQPLTHALIFSPYRLLHTHKAGSRARAHVSGSFAQHSRPQLPRRRNNRDPPVRSGHPL
jgi:hypothetical protein